MSFDGEYQLESPKFETIDEVWEYSNNIGSKWFFYPFHFAVSGSTVVDPPPLLEMFNRKRIKTVAREFAGLAKHPDMEDATSETFVFQLHFNHYDA